jgi:hypothetical protein
MFLVCVGARRCWLTKCLGEPAGLWGNVRARFLQLELGRLYITHRNSDTMATLLRPRLRSLLTTPTKRFKSHIPPKKKNAKWATAKCTVKPPDGPDGKRPFDATMPLRLKDMFKDLPAYEKWFHRTPGLLEIAHKGGLPHLTPKMAKRRQALSGQDPSTFDGVVQLNTEYLGQFGDTMVPLERKEESPRGGVVNFERFEGPLSLLFQHMEIPGWKPAEQLYLAQHSLADLPKELQDDLPTPDVIKALGKGDIYNSSLWMGKAPTCTPLHRDPNPNLFVQLSGKKKIRLLNPQVGQELYEQVMHSLGKSGGSASMRGEEMMQGRELEALENAVWNDEWAHPGGTLGFEVTVKKGGGLYIPLGWWHAVRGVGRGPNVSVSHSAPCQDALLIDVLLQVNWWFR